ncbi:uncharacterized protein SCODWIG_00204 [Saccharomycodes ludwigii]|uniref:D-isomer specific 2-hydroxyacid dehydrogenase NAD-binding domain-containing protein n=1 Tax=Saccharomycodes ludwigii TaxID=36035 RepID=A0A376B1A9_9ASCO|nr:hypothetical protein SCDLUD_001395 [Saccharomycodes ludwigii]KAH3901629.1 hypothetical protein SCDLUD_001395 [Saccharomycodes ludwigii]SSD58443.1 uncharacterized protein SCODWIG_00204 [Saccharomycodes ludwigii]
MANNIDKYGVLFIAEPDYSSPYYQQVLDNFDCKFFNFEESKVSRTNANYNTDTNTNGGKIVSFIEFIKKNFKHNVNPLIAIYCGYQAFYPINKLPNELLIKDEDVNSTPNILADLKLLVFCSKGVNSVDTEWIKTHRPDLKIVNFDHDAIANDVADCCLWHVLESFRKFSYQQSILLQGFDTIETRSIVRDGYTTANNIDTKNFAFGHELPQGIKIESPSGKKVLVLGFGRIGKKVCQKLKFGLDMKVFYSTRSNKKYDQLPYECYPWENILEPDESLNQFNCIVICLPGTSTTKNLINNKFLQKFKDLSKLSIINLGRGFIVDFPGITFQDGATLISKLRSFGTDVYYDEPNTEREICFKNKENDNSMDKNSLLLSHGSFTPHIASSTDTVYQYSSEHSLKEILSLMP